MWKGHEKAPDPSQVYQGMSSLCTIINVFAKLLILSDTLLFEYFRFEGKIIELDSANKFNNMTL